MLKQTVTPETLKREYGILCQRVYPREGFPTAFGSSWCEIEPGGATSPHDHFDGETFFVLEGHGRMRVGAEESEVRAGDTIYLPSYSNHVLTNLGTGPLRFISVWWDTAEPASRLPQRSMISVAPPTPNGGLHVGHLSGPYVASDVYRRYLRLRGADTHFVTGSDDNQSYVRTKGMKLGWSPQKVVDTFTASIRGTFARAGVEPDYFLRPMHTPEYAAYVQAFFTKLVERGAIVAREVEEPWCDPCQRFLFEAHLGGVCPHCGTGTNGHGCEKCGITNDGRDLRDAKCNACGTPAGHRTVRKLFFPLGEYRERLEAYWKTAAMSPRLRAFTDGVLAKGLRDVSASFVAGWGIPVPVPGFEGQVIYEWLEMAAGYLYMAETSGKGWNALTADDDGTEFAQFFGFDNAFFYTAFLPALFLAGGAKRLPRAFVTNEFYRLDGLKFSTSRNHAIWGDELLELVPADVARFFLAWDRPEVEQTNFTRTAFRETVKRELVDGLEGWLASLDARLAALGGVAPAPVLADASQRTFHARLRELARGLDPFYRADTFSLNEVARRLAELVRATVAFSRGQSFHAEATPERAGALALELAAVRLYANLAAPLMPGLSARLLAALGEEGAKWDLEAGLLPVNRRIGTLADGGMAKALQGIERL